MKRVEQRSKIVLAAGVFDLLHYGHLRFLEEAKKAGGKTQKSYFRYSDHRSIRMIWLIPDCFSSMTTVIILC